ncbi:MAG: hypothetical protein ABI569_11060, partial [Casimicrobiaceae bacterium]
MPSTTGRAAATLLFALTIGAAAPAIAQSGATMTLDGPKVVPAELNMDLRKLPSLPAGSVAPKIYRPLLKGPPNAKSGGGAAPQAPLSPPGPRPPMPGAIQNFPGMSFNDICGGSFFCGGGWPPDTNGDVGSNHFIQAVNIGYAVYDKTGTLLASFTEDQLFSTAGASACNGNSQGDPVVVYDALADRWILTHFAWTNFAGGPYFQCVAASKTSDPVTGGWWLYTLRMDPGGAGLPPVGLINDYPKFGAWHDCIIFSANEFNVLNPPATQYQGVAFGSLSRADLYNGNPLTWALGYMGPASNAFSLQPSHSVGRGPTAVAPGTPAWFVSESFSVFAFEVRKFTAGPNCGGGGSLSALINVPQTSYTGSAFGTSVPQPNTSTLLDNLADRVMQKLQYRKVGAAESLWVAHTVPLASNQSAIQWAQLDVTGGTIVPTAVQQQIYSPDTTLYRFMPSIGVDNQGNMAIGFSTSGATVPNFPSIAYSGRLVGDPANQ